jgi:hypothetical protein
VQGTAQFHHQIADTRLPQADPVFHNATTLDAAVDMLDPEPTLVERLVGDLLFQGEILAVWLLRRGGVSNVGSVSKVEMATPMHLIYKALFLYISTFETPPSGRYD